MLEFIREPWPWYVAGPVIAGMYTVLVLFGKTFGISSTLSTVCTIAGAGKKIPFFNKDWRNQVWNLFFALGSVLGGFIAANFLSNNAPIQLAQTTVEVLQSYGLTSFETGLYPKEIFNLEALFTVKGFVFMVIGGICVGFGTRWAGGCTSGHAITGLANLEPSSLVAVVGFFIGGLLTTHFVLPYLLQL